MEYVLYILCGMPKSTCWAEATSNSKPVALVVIELCLSEGMHFQFRLIYT